MKTKSATEAILAALIAGETLTTLNGFKDFGTSKLPTRLAEQERKYGFRCNRKEVHFKTKYGLPGVCLAYSMNRSDAKRVKKLLQVKK